MAARIVSAVPGLVVTGKAYELGSSSPSDAQLGAPSVPVRTTMAITIEVPRRAGAISRQMMGCRPKAYRRRYPPGGRGVRQELS